MRHQLNSDQCFWKLLEFRIFQSDKMGTRGETCNSNLYVKVYSCIEEWYKNPVNLDSASICLEGHFLSNIDFASDKGTWQMVLFPADSKISSDTFFPVREAAKNFPRGGMPFLEGVRLCELLENCQLINAIN